MTLRTKLFLSTLSAALAASIPAAQPAAAQAAAANFAAGAKVTDAQGGEVGTITSVDGEFVTVRTDKHEVRLPKASFTAHSGGFLFGMTRDQLNAEVEKAQAEAAAKLAAGATVTGSEGGTIGTIEAIDAELVTIKLTSGAMVRLPRTGIAAGPNGAVVGMTVAELEAAAKAAATPAEADAPAQ